MNTFFNHLKNEAEQVRLTKTEKDTMRSELLRAVSLQVPVGVISPYARFFSLRSVAAYSFVGLLVLSSGTAFAAQRSLPGNLLYPIKVHVEEPLETVFARTSEAKAIVNAQIAERRITEVQILARRGTLDATTTRAAERSFDDHTAQAMEFSKKSSRKSEPTVVTTMVTTFDVLSSNLASSSEQDTNEVTRKNSRDFADHVRARTQILLDAGSERTGRGRIKRGDEQ